MTIVEGRTAGRACLLARNDAARNHKDGLLLHHLGPLMAVIGRSVKQLPLNHLIDAALTLDFSRA
jgi:hypothetical protein